MLEPAGRGSWLLHCRGRAPPSAPRRARSGPAPFPPTQGLVRVYTKKVGHKPDFGDPVVLRCALLWRAAMGDGGGFQMRRPVSAASSPSAAPRSCCALTLLRSEDRGGTSMRHFCEMIHNSLVADFQYALVWGTSSKHMPQR